MRCRGSGRVHKGPHFLEPPWSLPGASLEPPWSLPGASLEPPWSSEVRERAGLFVVWIKVSYVTIVWPRSSVAVVGGGGGASGRRGGGMGEWRSISIRKQHTVNKGTRV